jgi:peroxiredoxin
VSDTMTAVPEEARPEEEPAGRGPDRRWRVVAIVLTPVVLFAALLGFGLGRDPNDIPSAVLGDPAPEFALRDIRTGDTVRMADLRGHVVVVNFWATWCPPCLEEMPAMERLYRQQKDAGFTLVAVSVDGDPKLVGPFVAKHKFTFPIALDAKMDLANSYTVRALPSSFVIARDGNLAALAIGPRHWDSDAAHSLIEGLAK